MPRSFYFELWLHSKKGSNHSIEPKTEYCLQPVSVISWLVSNGCVAIMAFRVIKDISNFSISSKTSLLKFRIKILTELHGHGNDRARSPITAPIGRIWWKSRDNRHDHGRRMNFIIIQMSDFWNAFCLEFHFAFIKKVSPTLYIFAYIKIISPIQSFYWVESPLGLDH